MRGRKRTGSGWEAGGRRVVSGTGVLLRAHGAVGEDADPSNLDAAEGFRTLPSASYTSTCTSSVRCVGEVAAAEAVGGGGGTATRRGGTLREHDGARYVRSSGQPKAQP